MKTAHSSRYMFLFDKPITYTRPLLFGEKRLTNVKLLVILYNEAVAHCSVYLYGANERVNWNEVLTKKIDYMNLIFDDNFLLENSKLDWFLERFGLQ